MSDTRGDFTSISTTNVCFQLAIRLANPPGLSQPARMLDSLVFVEIFAFKIFFQTTGETTDVSLVGVFRRAPAKQPREVVPRHLVADQRTNHCECLPAVRQCADEHTIPTRAMCGKHLRREKTRVRPPPGGGEKKQRHEYSYSNVKLLPRVMPCIQMILTSATTLSIINMYLPTVQRTGVYAEQIAGLHTNFTFNDTQTSSPNVSPIIKLDASPTFHLRCLWLCSSH